jgi:lipopolysaccharide export system protein LptC
MTSEHAHINQNQNQIDLSGNVDIQRPGAPAQPGRNATQPLRIRTEALTVLPDDEIAKTDKPVDLKLGETSASGVGMVVNNATQQVQMGGRGKIVLPPRAAR